MNSHDGYGDLYSSPRNSLSSSLKFHDRGKSIYFPSACSNFSESRMVIHRDQPFFFFKPRIGILEKLTSKPTCISVKEFDVYFSKSDFNEISMDKNLTVNRVSNFIEFLSAFALQIQLVLQQNSCKKRYQSNSLSTYGRTKCSYLGNSSGNVKHDGSLYFWVMKILYLNSIQEVSEKYRAWRRGTGLTWQLRPKKGLLVISASRLLVTSLNCS